MTFVKSKYTIYMFRAYTEWNRDLTPLRRLPDLPAAAATAATTAAATGSYSGDMG